MNKFMTKYFMAIFGGIFALVGTIIIIVGIITNVKMSQFEESAVEVNGVIEDIVIVNIQMKLITMYTYPMNMMESITKMFT